MPNLKPVIESSLAGAVEHAKAQRVTLPASHPLLETNGLSISSVIFCQYWPMAKPVLLSLQQFLPTWTAWIVNILLSVGDKACPGT
jgi:hypothetical protein